MLDTAMHTASTAATLTKYGRMRMNYLKKHKPLVYNKMQKAESFIPIV